MITGRPVRSGISSRTSSPRRHLPGQQKDVEVDNLTQRVRIQDEMLAEAHKKMEAMQLTMRDFQVILTSHEKEVEGLWAHAGKGAGKGVGANPQELLDLKRQVAQLSERLELAETRNVKPMVPESLQASTMELLFQQNREFMDELDIKLKATQDAALRESDRTESQLAAIREALQLGDRQQDYDLRASESKITRNLQGIQNETHALWSCLAAALSSPNVPVESLGDKSVSLKVSSVRDSILNAISNHVSHAVETVRREADDKTKLHEAGLQKLQSAIHRNDTLVSNVASEMKESSSALIPTDAAHQMIDALRRQTEHQVSELQTKITAQQLGAVDIDRRLTEKLQHVGDAFGRMEGVVAKLDEESCMDRTRMQDIMAQLATLREEQLRSGGDSRDSALAFQEQCNDVIQRHVAEVRERLQQQQQDTKAQLHIAGEKALAANRLSEAVRAQMDDMAGQNKRLQSQLHEVELTRKEDLRRIQQDTTNSVTRVQQLTSSDLHRLQKETTQELQRYEDAAGSLYRTVEELRGVQQRTLEEYHRQGDEQAMVHAKFQQQLTEVNSTLKEQLQTESDRMHSLVRTETQTLNDQIVRTKTDLGERAGATERRMQEAESAIDSFRGRLRTLEMNENGRLDKTIEDLKQKQIQLDARTYNLDTWRNETNTKLAGMDTRIAEAGNAQQISGITHKLDEVERGLLLARGPEKEEMRRTIKSDVEKQVRNLEGRIDKSVDKLNITLLDHENMIKELTTDVSDCSGRVKQNLENITRVDSNTQTAMKRLKDNIAKELQPKIDGVSMELKNHTRTVDGLAQQAQELDVALKALSGTNEAMGREVKRQEEQLTGLLDGLTKFEGKFVEVETLVKELKGDFEGFKNELISNTEQDEKRERELRRIIEREIEIMTARKLEMEQSFQKAYDAMNSKIEAIKRDTTKMADDLIDEVREKSKIALEEIKNIHANAADLHDDTHGQLAEWRDRVAACEMKIGRCEGTVDATENQFRRFVGEQSKRLQDMESDYQNTKTRLRSLEKE